LAKVGTGIVLTFDPRDERNFSLVDNPNQGGGVVEREVRISRARFAAEKNPYVPEVAFRLSEKPAQSVFKKKGPAGVMIRLAAFGAMLSRSCAALSRSAAETGEAIPMHFEKAAGCFSVAERGRAGASHRFQTESCSGRFRSFASLLSGDRRNEEMEWGSGRA
jgi:hypothetical protein